MYQGNALYCSSFGYKTDRTHHTLYVLRFCIAKPAVDRSRIAGAQDSKKWRVLFLAKFFYKVSDDLR